jgi:uncharacterized protein with NRDE domain
VCTLVLAWQVFADAPVVVAANRDERLERESEPPVRRDWAQPAVAPQDVEAGGTWVGYNEPGVFAGITNRWTDASLDGERSRGLLVRDVLGQESAEEAARVVEHEVRAREYQGFNLVIADATAAIYLEWSGGLRVRNLDPGIHVVVNVGADGNYVVPAGRPEAGEAQADNAERVRTVLQPEPGEDSRSWLDRAAAVIADHEYGVCVHGDGFGTRSSSLIRLGNDATSYEYAPGPPCETVATPVERDS